MQVACIITPTSLSYAAKNNGNSRVHALGLSSPGCSKTSMNNLAETHAEESSVFSSLSFTASEIQMHYSTNLCDLVTANSSSVPFGLSCSFLINVAVPYVVDQYICSLDR